ncbi:MAG: sulfatase [Blastopirellula sp.]|nr:MAG: sulfatase [Blastopirellula sp.]
MRRLSTLAFLLIGTVAQAAQDRPNILWITSEDNGPELGCYGDDYATSPNIDSIAAKGMIYLNAWSTAPVCAPARTTIISGIYPPATGSEHMRSITRLPANFDMYPAIMRKAGYYCTNRSKEDYNLVKVGQVWDESSGKAHWRNRKPGQPFFAVFNYTISHESKLRTRPHKQIHDPAKVYVPKYHPDTPEVRQDWAQYYDKVTEMDTQVGGLLKQLKEDGLEEDTIVLYYGDHGSGMPRSKRWPYNSGLQVPMIVHVPAKWKSLAPKEYQEAGSSERLVGFIDLAATLLSTASIEPPKWMQGHAFMGKYETPDQDYAFGFRGRMDERYDMVRTCGNGRYVYIRNFMPHKIYGQYIQYMFQTPTTRIWKEMFDAGKLTPEQSLFWQRKPFEELYDLETDPDEVVNLANSAKHQAIKNELKTALHNWQAEIRDVGFLPEDEIHTRSKDSSPYEVGHDPKQYDLEKIQAIAEVASEMNPNNTSKLVAALRDKDSAVRYWGAMGVLMRGKDAVSATSSDLENALYDESKSVQILAAQCIAQFGKKKDRDEALSILIQYSDGTKHGIYIAMLACNALDEMDEKAISVLKEIEAIPTDFELPSKSLRAYMPNLKTKILADLKKTK